MDDFESGAGISGTSRAYDVVVVGAGPAGSTAARVIAAGGASVLMLDRARFPRDKPCGGGVTIRCANLLPFSIEPVIEDVVTRARLRFRERAEVVRDAPAPLTYMTQRRHLDRFLAERAQEAGAEFRDGQTVTDVQGLPDGTFEVRTRDSRFHARVVIGADGANGVVGNRLGYEAAAEHAVALEGNYYFAGGVPDEYRHQVALNFGHLPGGYGWIFPKGDHVNVGVGGWKSVCGPILRPALQRLARAYGLDPDRLQHLRGHHLPMQRRGMTIAASGSAVIGDAAGLVDPLSGEGILAALTSGTAIGPVVRDYLDGRVDTLAGYQHALERDYLHEVDTSTALMEIFNAAPAPFVWMLQHVGPFWNGACRMIRGETTYTELAHFAGPVSYTLLGPTARASRLLNVRFGAR